MAYKKLHTIEFPGLENIYTIPQTAEELPITDEDETTIAEALNQQSATIADLGTDLSAEVARATAKDSEHDDRLKFLEAVNEGKTFITETDSTEAYSKTIKSNVIPEGNKALVQKIGGKTYVKNQLAPAMTGGYAQYNFATLITYSDNVATIKSNGSSGSSGADINYRQLSIPVGSKILFSVKCKKNFTHDCEVKIQSDGTPTTKIGDLSEEYSTFSYVFTANSNVVRIGVAFPTVYFDYSETVNIKEFEIIVLSRWFNGDSTILSSITTPEDAYALGVPHEYIPYNSGELISADCSGPVSRGKNLIDDSTLVYESDNKAKLFGYFYPGGNEGDETEINGGSLGTVHIQNINLKRGKTYTLYGNFDIGNSSSEYMNIACRIKGTTTYKSIGNINVTATKTRRFTADNDYDKMLFVRYSNGQYFTVEKNSLQLEEGSTATPYVPYVGILGTLEIPSALRTAHPLRSAGNAYDEYNFERKYTKVAVGKYTFTGNESWYIYIDGSNTFYTNNLPDAKYANDTLCICDKLTGLSSGGGSSHSYGCWFQGNEAYKRFYVSDPSLVYESDPKSFTNGMNLHYELATPIYYYDPTSPELAVNGGTVVPDATHIVDEESYFPTGKPQLPVESGGTITFEQTDSEFPVPNTISYLRKVATA